MALNIPLYRPGEAGAISPQLDPLLTQLMGQRFKPQELELQKQEMAQNAAHQRMQEKLWGAQGQRAAQDANWREKELEFKKQQMAQDAAHQRMQEQLWGAQGQKAAQDAAWTRMLLGGAPEPEMAPQQQSGMPMQMPAKQPGAQSVSPEPQQPDYGALREMFQGRGMFASPEQPSEQPSEQPQIQPQPEREPVTPSSQMQGVEVLQEGNPRTANLNQYAGIKGVPKKEVTVDSDGNMITTYPNGMITKQHISPSSSEKKLSEGIAGADADVYKEMQKQAIGSMGPQKTLKSLRDVYSSPVWKNMVENDLSNYGTTGRRLNIAYYKNKGTDKQKDLIGRVESLSGKMITDMAQVFKGPFRITEQTLLETIKPQPSDTFPAATAKLDELQKMADLESAVSKRTAQLMAKEKMSALDAFERAKDEYNADEYAEVLKQKYAQPEEESMQQERQQAAQQPFDFSQYEVAR